jgi:hypothetical protein
MFQVPVRYPVTADQPTSCDAISKPPMRVINESTEITVWLSQNSGMRIGEGTPLFPGTSLLWEEDGGFYAIGEGIADIIVTGMVGDWQPNPIAIATSILNSGVLLVDDPQILWNQQVTAPNFTTTFDVSRYQSMNIRVANAGGAPGRVTITFYITDDAGLFLPTLVYELQMTATDVWSGHVPAMHNAMRIRALSGGPYEVLVVSSNRQVAGLRQDGGSPFLASAFGQTVLAGAALTQDIIPWFGMVRTQVQLTSLAAMGASELQQTLYDVAGGAAVVMQRVTPGAAGGTVNQFQATLDFPMAGGSAGVVLNNTTGVNFTNVQLITTPISGFGLVA